MRSHLTLPGFNGRYRIYTTGKVWDKHLKVFLKKYTSYPIEKASE